MRNFAPILWLEELISFSPETMSYSKICENVEEIQKRSQSSPGAVPSRLYPVGLTRCSGYLGIVQTYCSYKLYPWIFVSNRFTVLCFSPFSSHGLMYCILGPVLVRIYSYWVLLVYITRGNLISKLFEKLPCSIIIEPGHFS